MFCARVNPSMTLTTQAVLATATQRTDDENIAPLSDGGRWTVSTLWFPRLAEAGPSERYALGIGNGGGIRWPYVGEDSPVAERLAGTAEYGGNF